MAKCIEMTKVRKIGLLYLIAPLVSIKYFEIAKRTTQNARLNAASFEFANKPLL